MTEIECVLNIKAALGEGAIWDREERALFWVDIPAGRLHRFDPVTLENRTWQMPDKIGCVALRRTGGAVVALANGFHALDFDTGDVTPICDPEPQTPGNRFNDGATDPVGRFWAGTMPKDGPGDSPEGALYRLDPDGTAPRMGEPMWVPNGMAFSPDGRTMYLSDSYVAVRTIWAFDYDCDTGTPSNRRVFLDTHVLAGRPDGAAVDADGCYWMAGVGGWQIVRITPEGKIDRIIPMPVERPTKIAFGGDNLDIMFVTSIGPKWCTPGTLDRQPNAGAIFAIRAGVQGIPTPRYAG